jgi:hypothetical protein
VLPDGIDTTHSRWFASMFLGDSRLLKFFSDSWFLFHDCTSGVANEQSGVGNRADSERR